MKRKFDLPALIRHCLMIVLIIVSSTVTGQTYNVGTDCGGGGGYSYTNHVMTDKGAFWQKRIQENFTTGSGSRKWEFNADSYFNTWRAPSGTPISIAGHNQVVPPSNSTASAYWRNSSGGGDGARLLATTSGNYYTFNLTESGYANCHMAVLESGFNPKTFVSITSANTTAYADKLITVVLSAAPSAGENVYLRYTINGYTNSVIIPFSFVGATGTATIPTQTRNTTISYYAYTSPRSKSAIDADVATYGQLSHDMSTLELSSGGSYTIPNLPVIMNSTAGTLSGTPTGYSTLKLAFDAINAGTANTGVVTIGMIGNTTETVSAVLNQVAGVTSVLVTATGGAIRQINGALAAPIIDLNSADNVTIDGVNADANALIINNTTVAGAGTSTIRLFNSATGNIIQNCTISGSTTSSTDGTITFGSGFNNNNTISNNTIRSSGANLPGNAVYSNTSSPGSNNMLISGNNFQDYWSSGTGIPSCGINLANNNSGWTITGNRFYQTSARTATAAATHRAIWINSGGGYTITDNVIGFANSTGTGTTTYNGSFANKFVGIDLNVTTTATSVQNNTIAGITMSSTSGATTAEGIFSGIYVQAGTVNIGNVAGNKIGVPSTGLINITGTQTSTAILVNGISVTASGASNISNNTVAAFSLPSATPSVGYTFNGIFIGGSSAVTVAGNTVNAITVGGSSTTGNCVLNGINNAATGTVTIGGNGTGNYVSNLSLPMAAGGTGTINGILQSASGASNIVNNTVNTLSTSHNVAIVNAINVTAGTTIGIARNKIYDVFCTGSAAVINGVNCVASTTAINISNNIIGDLRATALTNSVSPNSIQGINLNSASAIPINVFFNTVMLSGTATGTTAFGSAALYASATPTLGLRNNILCNNTTPKGTGNAVAYQRANNTFTTYAAASNNNLFYAGTPGTNNLIFFEAATSANDQTLAAYKTRVGGSKDAVSISVAPTFLSTVGSNVDFLHISPVSSPIESGGAQISAAYQDDFDATGTRPFGGYPLPGQVNGSGTAPDIGADEFDGGGSFTWNGNTSSSWNVATNWTPNGIPGASDFVTLKNGAPNALNLTTAVTVFNINFSGTGNFFSVASTGSITVSADVYYVSGTGTWDCASTFIMSSTTLQPVPPFNYGNLSLGTGNRTLPNVGTVGICGAYTPTSATTTATGSTVSFNGSGVQVVPVSTYASVTIANTNPAHVTLAGNLIVPTALTISGGSKLDIGANTLNITGSTSVVNGTLRSNGTITGATASTLTFSSTGIYEHNYTNTQGIIPLATWNATSTCSIIGYTTFTSGTAAGNWGQSFGNFTWNCNNQTATLNLQGNLITINGDFNILSTGTGVSNNGLRLSNTNTTLTVAGNLNVTSGASTDAKLDFNSTGGAATTIELSKNLTLTQGAGSVKLQVGTGFGIINFSGTVNQVVTIPAIANVTNSMIFRVNNANGITIPTGSVLPVTASGTFYRRLGAVTLVGTGSINYTATSVLAYDPIGTTAITTADAEWPVATEPRNVLINSTSTNPVTLHASRTLSGTSALVLTAGVLRLGNNTLTISNNATTVVSRTSGYVETSGTGTLTWYISTTPGTYVFPVGNGTAYTPAQFAFSANSVGNRPLSVRSVGTIHPNMGTPASYINNRYWVTSIADITGTYTYTPGYTFISPGDVVGTIGNIRLSRWNTLVWANIINSSASGTLLAATSALTESTGNLNNAQWAGRTTIPPVTYTWSAAASGLWTTSSNWTPVGVPTSGDVVQFLHNGTYTVSNTPTDIVLARIVVAGTGATTLTTPLSGNLGINGGSAPQLSIGATSTLVIGGPNAIAVNLPTGNTGTVSGKMILRDASHMITASDAAGLTFPTGSKFEAGVVNTNTFTGNPFGSTGTTNTVVFQSGSVFEQFSGSNPFGLTQPNSKVVFQAGSLYKYSDNNIIATPSFTGRTFANFEYNSTLAKAVTGGTGFTMTDLTVSQSTFNVNMDATCSIQGNINVATGAALAFTPATAGTFNLNSGGNQSISGAGSLTINSGAIMNVAAFTNVTLQKDMTVDGTGRLVNAGVLYLSGENIVSGTGTLNNGATGLLGIASQYGITAATTGATGGNVQTTTRTFNAAGTYIYNSIVSNQVTGNGLPASITGALTISNTASSPDNIVTLSRNTTTARLNLDNGRFNAGTALTLSIAAGGVVNGAGGNQYLSGAATDNVIRFLSNGAVQGTPELYNVTAGSSGAGVDFVNNARINGIFLINSGGFINPNAPKYAVGSTLIYSTAGSYNRNVEWGSTTAGSPSYPYHVIIRNGTMLNFTNTTTFDVGCGGNLTIGNPAGAGTGELNLYDMATNDLIVGGNLILGGVSSTGTLSLSNTIGGDLRLYGDWNRNANGVINFGSGNGRAVFFEGSTDANIIANGGQTFPYVYINKATTATKVTLNDHVTITDEISFTRGTTDLGTNNKFLTILSTATKTARVGPSVKANTAFIYGVSGKLGQFIVQRYVPARRSWRLMAAPLDPAGGTHTISEAWQERGSPLLGLDYSTAAATTASQAADTISSNFATMITGGSAANGFDRSSNNNPSIKYFNGITSWPSPVNINATSVNSREGWMLFLRGDRKAYGQITNQYKAPNITTLRPRGPIFIGSKAITSTGLTVVGNPYASALDYNTATRTGAISGTATYYMYDPYLGGDFGTGAFVTLTWNGTNFTRSAPLTGTGTSAIDDRYIPSGAAILVDFGAGGTLTFKESDKSSAETTTAYRTTGQLQTGLFFEENGRQVVVDGVVHLFSKDFNTALDRDDAIKMSNFSENLGITKDDKTFVVERRQPVSAKDTIFFSLRQMKLRQYKFAFIMNEIGAPANTVAYLEDNYLNTKTRVSLQDTTWAAFNITTDTGSYKANRFMLVFAPVAEFTNVNAYPNKENVDITWQVKNEWNIDHYTVERSTDGRTFTATGNSAAKANNVAIIVYGLTDIKPAPGLYYYRIKATSLNGDVVYSETVKVQLMNTAVDLYIFPNPVIDNTITVQINDLPIGIYRWKLVNNVGQVISKNLFAYSGGSVSQKIVQPSPLVPGVYQLEVNYPGQQVTTLQIVVR